MNKLSRWALFLLSFFCWLTPSPRSGFAQEWVKLMEAPAANFYEVQRSFNEYWQDKDVDRGRGWKQFKRWEYFMEPRVYPSGRLPDPDVTVRALIEHRSSRGPAVERSLGANWTPLGPSSWLSTSYNPGIGRINATAVHPNDSNIIFVGAPSGGLWKSLDSGSSWSTATDGLSVLGVTSIVIDPTNPSIMYVASGDGDAGDTYSIGVLKSTDGGATWNATGLNWAVSQTRRISKLLIHPTDSNILLAATNQGVYRSTDAGSNWTVTQSGNFKDIEFKPGDPSTVYVCGDSFYRATDNGVSFSLITSGLPSSYDLSRMAIAVTPAGASYVYLVAGRSQDSGFYGLYRSLDSGSTFSLRSSSPNILDWSSNGSGSGGQSWYDLAIAVSPTNVNEVYVGGINIWKSTNSGSTWTLNTYWVYPPIPYGYVHADIHCLDFYGSTLLCGSDGGVFRTTNAGATWTDLSSGLQMTQFYRMGGSATNAALVYAGSQDNGTNRYQSGVWTHVLGADGMECIVDPGNTNIVYASTQNGGLKISFDGGVSFSSIASNMTESGAWVTPYILAPDNSQTLFAGFTNVWKSTNRGASWLPVSNFSGSVLRSLAMAPSNASCLYAATYRTFYKTTNGGSSWTNISAGLPTADAALTYIAVSRTDPNKLWVTFSGYSNGNKVFASSNGGSTWTNLSGSLPNLPVNCIAHHSNGLYVGTDVGVYFRGASASEWQPFQTNLPNVIVSELEIHESSGQIRAATYGRGLWQSPLQTGCGICGDIDSDGATNSTDALVILSYDAGIAIPADYLNAVNAGCADVNNDGATNSTDALIVLTCDAGLPECPSVVGQAGGCQP